MSLAKPYTIRHPVNADQVEQMDRMFEELYRQAALGVTGTTGIASGTTGATGASGTTTIIGAAGIPGLEGEAGPEGDQGRPGIQGLQGLIGIGQPGADGEAGADGDAGPPGLAGATGPTGPTGATGTAGAQGVDGEDGGESYFLINGGAASTGGLTNAQIAARVLLDTVGGSIAGGSGGGATGAQGPTGSVVGVPGIPGVDGEDGRDGVPIIGPAGPAGAVTLLFTASGTDSNTNPAVISSYALASQLGSNDTLWVLVGIESNGTSSTTLAPQLVNVTDSVAFSPLGNPNIGTNLNAIATAWLRQSQSVNTRVDYHQTGWVGASISTAGAKLRQGFTTPWTGNWTLGLQHGGTAGGATVLTYRWSIYRIAG